MRRLWVPVVAAALAACPAPAAAEPVALSTVPANVPISAHGGWVVWSTPAPGGVWSLVAWHNGQARPLPISHRSQPFDVDAGTDARGRAVVTFSRCITAPQLLVGRLQPWTGEGCRVRVVDLASGRERAAGVPRPPGASDTTPSMWRGRVAFARTSVRNPSISQVLLWSPSSRRVTRVPHGGIPNCPSKGPACKGVTVRGAVQGLDLGSRLASFLWWVQGPRVVGHGGWEVRADRLGRGRSVLTGSGYLGEACAGGNDSYVPSTPSADGDNVWYSVFASACYVDKVTVARFNTRTRRAAFGDLPGEILRLAPDGAALYALVAPTSHGYPGPTCETPGAPCTIERLEPPALASRPYTPHSPFF
jgi:hypothetical protein